MNPQLEYEHIQALMDEHIATRIKDLEKYSQRHNAKQEYIDRQWVSINMQNELKKATRAYIASMEQELVMARVNTAMQAKVIGELERELGKQMELDILLEAHGKS